MEGGCACKRLPPPMDRNFPVGGLMVVRILEPARRLGRILLEQVHHELDGLARQTSSPGKVSRQLHATEAAKTGSCTK
jgi:hypothetical protein